ARDRATAMPWRGVGAVQGVQGEARIMLWRDGGMVVRGCPGRNHAMTWSWRGLVLLVTLFSSLSLAE
ncbi:hypothetical protein PIB30_054196, partial [Stylosanthes scabra]|nr:hypothetical protein [Stylosanthes scabra]